MAEKKLNLNNKHEEKVWLKPKAIKKGQEEMVGFISHVNRKGNRKGQEEMVGFALIVVLIAVILIVFLSLTIKSNKNVEVESYKVESFTNTILQYTSNCEDNFGFKSVSDLIFMCSDNEACYNGESSCDILNKTLGGILDSSYKVGENRVEKGFLFNISVDGAGLVSLSRGNITSNEKGARSGFLSRGKTVEIVFKTYN